MTHWLGFSAGSPAPPVNTQPFPSLVTEASLDSPELSEQPNIPALLGLWDGDLDLMVAPQMRNMVGRIRECRGTSMHLYLC